LNGSVADDARGVPTISPEQVTVTFWLSVGDAHKRKLELRAT